MKRRDFLVKINEKLQKIQCDLKVPKSKFNKFGGFNYRSCEDILNAVKPFLDSFKCYLEISDDIIQVGDRIYVKATGRLCDSESNEKTVDFTGLAREQDSKKGMDMSQITGSSSTYARKYMLNAMFLLDDAEDPDNGNNDNKPTPQNTQPPKPILSKEQGMSDRLANGKQACIELIPQVYTEKPSQEFAIKQVNNMKTVEEVENEFKKLRRLKNSR